MNTSDFPISTESNRLGDSVFAQDKERRKKAIIIGAGPAGLVAAYELLTRTDIIPVVLEKSDAIGGNSKTIDYKGNLIDIGGHRFISRSERVTNWCSDFFFTRKVDKDVVSKVGSSGGDDIMVIRRSNSSRFYFFRQFFACDKRMNYNIISSFGIIKSLIFYFSYLKAKLFPRKAEHNLKDFLINRFGHFFYSFFFENYVEKLWGMPCNDLPAELGLELIDEISPGHFWYPKLGPGQIWEEVANQIEEMGGRIQKGSEAIGISSTKDKLITAVRALNFDTQEISTFEADYFFFYYSNV